ncbi:hypothetical protein J7I44_06535 [Frateuria sp. MAH-13]|uniref:Lipoprotein n=1 Tax=Frateuria flava TaxID=2821489 RepID=A0ABS4DLM7_9GAMM|nr:DUF6624 domain-containing protein [Frateuria flava]MBP1473948.1 hypothetical protein [Frateuria flava]
MDRARVVLLTLLAAWPVGGFATDTDAALMKACPGLAAWAEQHPHGDAAAAKADGGRHALAPTLREALAVRAAADARVRDAAMAQGTPSQDAMQAVLAVDRDNLAWLKGVVARQGFPTLAQVGAQGMADAWLLAQHADRDSAFQLQLLRTLQARGADAGVRKQDLAMLTDRVLLAQGKPQRYGTQFKPDASGALAMQPVEDEAGLDARRASAGLMPLAIYRCVLGASYALPVAQ